MKLGTSPSRVKQGRTWVGIQPMGASDVSEWGLVQHQVTSSFGATKRPVPPVKDVGTLWALNLSCHS